MTAPFIIWCYSRLQKLWHLISVDMMGSFACSYERHSSQSCDQATQGKLKERQSRMDGFADRPAWLHTKLPIIPTDIVILQRCHTFCNLRYITEPQQIVLYIFSVIYIDSPYPFLLGVTGTTYIHTSCLTMESSSCRWSRVSGIKMTSIYSVVLWFFRFHSWITMIQPRSYMYY